MHRYSNQDRNKLRGRARELAPYLELGEQDTPHVDAPVKSSVVTPRGFRYTVLGQGTADGAITPTTLIYGHRPAGNPKRGRKAGDS